jgi:replicative DNA helicase
MSIMPKNKRVPETEDELMVKALYSAEAEKAVLGCMLAQPGEVIEEAINVPIEEGDFFVPAHQIIFRCLVEMYEEGESIDVMTLNQWLTDRLEGGRTLAERAGAPGILAEILVGFATHLNVASYFRIVKEKAILRALERVARELKADVIGMPDSVGEVLGRAESALTGVIDSVRYHSDADFGMEIEEAALSILEHADSGGGLRGLPTGFKKMDELTMGWIAGELIVVAARPGKGKTGLMLAFIKTLVENQFNVETASYDIPGRPVQMFSMEMRRTELYMRLYAMKAGVGLTNILTGSIGESERGRIKSAQSAMSRWPIFIDDTPRMDIALLRARARRAVRKNKVTAIFVDYLQLMKSRKYPRDPQNELADISGQLKAIAMENEVPVIALAQLSRKADEGDKEDEPQMSHIKGSGAIEQDADKIILLHQDTNADRRSKQSDNVKHYKAILAKHRNGKQGSVEMDFQAWKVYFTEADMWNRT